MLVRAATRERRVPWRQVANNLCFTITNMLQHPMYYNPHDRTIADVLQSLKCEHRMPQQ